jgi:hypothetical protein
MAHACLTHLKISGSVGFVPYMRMPTRQMRERSTWTPHSVASVSVSDSPICHQGGICTTILRYNLRWYDNRRRQEMRGAHYEGLLRP